MTAVAIFVKTPGLSPVKTRLAQSIGSQLAEQWYVRAARVVTEIADSSSIGPVFWAVSEPEAVKHELWKKRPVIEQGGGGLGERMACVHNHLVEQHGSALLLGADAPQIDPAWLQQAALWLENTQPRCCIGPARDGGFWTFGANRAINLEHWRGIDYSQADTLLQFRRKMRRHGEWLPLPRLSDLDEIHDLTNLTDELVALKQPSPGQQELLEWMQQSLIGLVRG